MRFCLVLTICLFIAGCGAAPGPGASNGPVTNSEARNQRSQSTIGHSVEDGRPEGVNAGGPGEKRKWSQSGDPIDTSAFDTAIKVAEIALKAKPNDPTANAVLAEAYFDRGVALTNARQYASALGDYRRAMKYEPNHAGSREWERQILVIYQGLNMEPPKPGEEPPPLPFKKS